MVSRRALLRTVSGAVVVATAGCSGQGGSDGGGTPADDGGYGGGGDDTPTPTPTATPSGDGTDTATPAGSAAQQAYPDYNWDQLDGASATATATVTMSGFAFDPLIARLPPGTTVTYRNEDSAAHTVTVPALDVDVEVSGGGETTVTVESVGTYDYLCRFHGPDMLGRLVVEEGVTLGEATTQTEDGGGGGAGY